MADKKNQLMSAIESREEALKLTRECGNAFLVVAAIQAAVSFVIGFSILFDAAIFAICGYFIRSRQSRAAAIVALLLASASLAITVMNKLGQAVGGGNNIFLAIIIFVAAVRAVEATFKLRGRFAAVPQAPAA
jgi:F0F1-type ATP synthase assembly protein I